MPRTARMRARAFRALTGLLCLVVVMIAAVALAKTDEQSQTEAIVRDVQASPRKAIAAELITRSQEATVRATKLRSDGDEQRARLADGLARVWAEAARDLVRAADIEDQASAARRAATDAGAVAERERALVEEGVAQSGRLRAQLEALETESKQKPARTSAAANTKGDANPGPAPRRDSTASTSRSDGGAPSAPPSTSNGPTLTRDGGAR